MAERNNAGRASRSAVNNGARPMPRQSQGQQRRPAPAGGQRRPARPRQPQGAPMRAPARGGQQPARTARPAVQGRPVQQRPARPMEGAARGGRPQRDPRVARDPRPVRGTHAEKRRGAPKGNSRPVRPDNRRRRPDSAQPKPQAPRTKRSNEWIYPEGYTPPKQSGRRPAADKRKRAPARKKQDPVITVDWKRFGSVMLAVFIRFVVCLVIVASVMGIVYRNIFYSDPKPPVKNVTYTFITVEGEGEDAKTNTSSMTCSYGSAYKGEEMLISFSEVSKWLGTAQVGDVYSMRFILGEGTDADEDVVFHNGSHNAIVNGTIITMKASAQFRNGEVWIPLSFILDYMEGIETVKTEEAVSLSLSGEGASFILRPISPLTSAEPPED